MQGTDKFAVTLCQAEKTGQSVQQVDVFENGIRRENNRDLNPAIIRRGDGQIVLKKVKMRNHEVTPPESDKKSMSHNRYYVNS